MGKSKGRRSTNTHGGARSASTGKGQGSGGDTGDSIQGETLRMIQVRNEATPNESTW